MHVLDLLRIMQIKTFAREPVFRNSATRELLSADDILRSEVKFEYQRDQLKRREES